MRSLASLVPIPRRVRLAGRDLLVSEFRIRDLARLQAWLDDRWTHPLDWLIENLPRLEKGQRKAIRDAYERAEAGPPALGTPEAADLLESAEGIIFELGLILRRHQPELPDEELVQVLTGMLPGEYAKVRRIAYGTDPIETIARMLVPHERERKLPDWHRAIDSLAALRHWTYPQIYDLTLSEFANVRLGGKPPEPPGPTARPGESMAELQARTLAEWNRDDDE